MIKKIKIKTFSTLDIIIVVLLTVFTTILTIMLFNIITDNNKYVNLSDDQDLQKFLEVYASVVTDYYEEVETGDLIEGAIKGMFEYLGDDYTEYLNESEASSLDSKLEGTYKGIGVQIIDNNVIYRIIANSPASKSNLEENDIIIAVNDQDVQASTASEIAELIKNSEDGKVVLKIKRAEEELEVKVNVEDVEDPVVWDDIIETNGEKIGYLFIESFSGSTTDQFKSRLERLENEDIDSLIIDLRDNTGGYLSSAEEVASMFLEEDEIIYMLEDKDNTRSIKDDTEEHRDYEIVVITNGVSASASEILAAALKESYGAKIVGDTTYGKGKVQQQVPLSNGTLVKYTSSKWLTPNGNYIEGEGLEPDYKIEIDHSLLPTSSEDPNYQQQLQDYINHVNSINQQQYDKAVEILSK